MKVLLVNTFDRGGAANACIRLHLGLLKIGINSTLLVLKKTRNDIPKVVSYYDNVKFKSSFLKKISNSIRYRIKDKKYYEINEIELKKLRNKRDKRLDLFSSPISKYDITKTNSYKEADIVNLHWVAGFIDYCTFFNKNMKPIFWTLHDMFPFTLGEHYSERFLGIDENGFPLKRKMDDFSILMEKIHFNIVSKKNHFENLQIISPSNWLLQESIKSKLFSKLNHSLIVYGFDTEIFCFSKNQNLVKTKILFVADNINHERKGLNYLLKAIEHISNVNIEFIAIGGGVIDNPKIKHIGRIDDEKEIALIYKSVNLFIIPSLEDNLPNTMIESLLCGTPVVGFPVGGINDAIIDGFNGFICNEISVTSLKNHIVKAIDNLENFNRFEISKQAQDKYNLDKQANSYLELFLKSIK
jgi:glycosyltransferase involved in cell wall biosynthesis